MRRSRFDCLFVCVSVINALTQAVDAGFPSVQFDVAPTIECRDVTPAKFTTANPDERLVEVTDARVSVVLLTTAGSDWFHS